MRPVTVVIAMVMVAALTAPAGAILGFPETVEGVVESIEESTLAVLQETEETQQIVEVVINEETQFEETLKSLINLKEGDQVKIKYREDGDMKVALFVEKIIEEGVTEIDETLL